MLINRTSVDELFEPIYYLFRSKGIVPKGSEYISRGLTKNKTFITIQIYFFQILNMKH